MQKSVQSPELLGIQAIGGCAGAGVVFWRLKRHRMAGTQEDSSSIGKGDLACPLGAGLICALCGGFYRCSVQKKVSAGRRRVRRSSAVPAPGRPSLPDDWNTWVRMVCEVENRVYQLCRREPPYAGSIQRDLAHLPVSWIGDIDYWNRYYWLCGPKDSWRFASGGDVYDLCTFTESNLVSIAVVDAVGYFVLNCYPSRLYRVEIPLSPCSPELVASDLGQPGDMEYIPVLLVPAKE